jgi:hypothetical protein
VQPIHGSVYTWVPHVRKSRGRLFLVEALIRTRLFLFSILGPDPKRREEIRVGWTDLMKQQYGQQLEEAKASNDGMTWMGSVLMG